MKKKAIGYDYGKCEICNTPMQEKLIKQLNLEKRPLFNYRCKFES